MEYPLSTGQAARLLGSTEPRLSELVRRRRVYPPPEIRAGRRLWTSDQVLQAAQALRVLDEALRARITVEAGLIPQTAPTDPVGVEGELDSARAGAEPPMGHGS